MPTLRELAISQARALREAQRALTEARTSLVRRGRMNLLIQTMTEITGIPAGDVRVNWEGDEPVAFAEGIHFRVLTGYASPTLSAYVPCPGFEVDPDQNGWCTGAVHAHVISSLAGLGELLLQAEAHRLDLCTECSRRRWNAAWPKVDVNAFLRT